MVEFSNVTDFFSYRWYFLIPLGKSQGKGYILINQWQLYNNQEEIKVGFPLHLFWGLQGILLARTSGIH